MPTSLSFTFLNSFHFLVRLRRPRRYVEFSCVLRTQAHQACATRLYPALTYKSSCQVWTFRGRRFGGSSCYWGLQPVLSPQHATRHTCEQLNWAISWMVGNCSVRPNRPTEALPVIPEWLQSILRRRPIIYKSAAIYAVKRLSVNPHPRTPCG